MSEIPRRRRKTEFEGLTSDEITVEPSVAIDQHIEPQVSIIIPDFTDITLPVLQYFEKKGIQTPQVWINQIRVALEKQKNV